MKELESADNLKFGDVERQKYLPRCGGDWILQKQYELFFSIFLCIYNWLTDKLLISDPRTNGQCTMHVSESFGI
jgi:hypothetical protein